MKQKSGRNQGEEQILIKISEKEVLKQEETGESFQNEDLSGKLKSLPSSAF